MNRLIFIQTVFRWCDAQDFGYDGDKGPNHWGEQYNTCFGKHQSPININSLTVKERHLPPLKLRGFDLLPNQTTITNNGHTGKWFVSPSVFFIFILVLSIRRCVCLAATPSSILFITSCATHNLAKIKMKYLNNNNNSINHHPSVGAYRMIAIIIRRIHRNDINFTCKLWQFANFAAVRITKPDESNGKLQIVYSLYPFKFTALVNVNASRVRMQKSQVIECTLALFVCQFNHITSIMCGGGVIFDVN